ncbi:hypothetical protein ILUMI_01085 [Ignelater luminosus]|uniref:Telomere length regulation protein TEL2 homolog n=1 Tax=Ignelater luminosus TaxID=2038154 RepID=A0A8K0GMJ8_IGNLU|nr:hypothetical protein ILUMI_01085 [Ignelater luminosus]
MSFPVSEKQNESIGGQNTNEAESSKNPAEANETNKQYVITLDSSTIDVINLLTRIQKINTQTDIEHILFQLQHLVEFYPGPLTVQKVVGYDEGLIDWELYVDRAYGQVLDLIISKFDHSFPFNNGKIHNSVRRLFVVENNWFFCEALTVLVRNLKNKELEDLSGIIVQVIEMLIKSDGLFSVLIYMTLQQKTLNDIQREDMNSRWENIVQILISLPNRIANILQGDVSNMFKMKNYCNVLILNIVKIIEFICDLCKKCDKFKNELTLQPISLLLSKILLNYNEHLNSECIKNFLEIAIVWHNNKLYADIWITLLENLNRPAIEVMAIMILQNPKGVNLLHQNFLNSHNWKYTLCTKIPLLSYYDHDNITPIYNLVAFINKSSESELYSLLLNLITTWSDKSAINHTSIEQHLYLTKYVILIIKFLLSTELLQVNRKKIQERIYSGIPVHLESPIEEIRVIGMVTGEIIVEFLNKDLKEQKDIKLKFDLENLTTERCQKLVRNLQGIKDFKLEINDNANKKTVEEIISVLIENGCLVHKDKVDMEYIPPERKFRNRMQTKQQLENEIVNESIKTTNLINIIDSTNFELDSDDDLEPYDTSNDDKVTSKSPPAYLRDLRDGLLETKDTEIFTLSLENCEKLIVSQLPDDDASMGLEILEILISLTPTFYVENFDSLVFQSCVAITSIYPAVYAEYLCKQFHMDRGTYSISHRLFMLDVLQESAKILSNIKPVQQSKPKPDNKSEKQLKAKKSNIEIAEEIIRKRLENKTRYFVRHKHFVYEKVNKFADVAPSFFYPLLHGFGKSHFMILSPKFDSDNMLLIHYLNTLSIFMCSAQNCTIAPKMAKELLLNVVWTQRHHREVKVRMAILNMIACIVINVPKTVLLSEFIDELIEIRLWLADLLSANVQRGEPNLDCRTLAQHVLCLVESVLKVDNDNFN